MVDEYFLRKWSFNIFFTSTPILQNSTWPVSDSESKHAKRAARLFLERRKLERRLLERR